MVVDQLTPTRSEAKTPKKSNQHQQNEKTPSKFLTYCMFFMNHFGVFWPNPWLSTAGGLGENGMSWAMWTSRAYSHDANPWGRRGKMQSLESSPSFGHRIHYNYVHIIITFGMVVSVNTLKLRSVRFCLHSGPVCLRTNLKSYARTCWSMNPDKLCSPQNKLTVDYS